MKRSRLVVLAAIMGFAVACSLLVGDPHPPPPPPPDPTCCDPLCPSGAVDNAVYVSPTGSGTACTRDAPCGNVNAAIQLLTNGAGVVLIASGAYTETVDLSNATSIALCGGYDPDGGWNRTDAAPTFTGSEARTVDNADHPMCVILDQLAIGTRTATAGETVYGVFASRGFNVSTMCLRDVTLDITAGGDGDAGAAGSPGVANACDDGGDGQSGSDGDNGAQTGSAGFTDAGLFQPHNGQNGNAGDPGTPGNFLAAQCFDLAVFDQAFCVTSASGCTKYCADASRAPSCSVGEPSCGGGGGGAGFGGVGGGASIGLVAVRVHVRALRLRVNTGRGGAGGSGGAGGGGGDATAGAPEQCFVCNTNDQVICAWLDAGVPFDAAIIEAGGHGGNGGAGSGGAGGWSCGVVLDDPTNVAELLSDAATITVGPPGVGAPGAPDGKAMRICFLDGGGIE